jgi:uncharacterized protein DUF2255
MAKSGADIAAEGEVQITYLWSKTGNRRTIPIWFTLSEGKMELLPMHGLRTKWFADVQKSGSLAVEVKGWRKETNPEVVRDLGAIEGIKQRFAAKYGEGDVRRYYPNQDVALLIPL